MCQPDKHVLTGYAAALLQHPYSPDVERLIADAELALSEALLAVKLTQSGYRKLRPVEAGDSVNK